MTNGPISQSIRANPGSENPVRSLLLLVVLIGFASISSLASPLSPLISLEGVRPTPSPALLSLSHTVDDYWQSDADQWQETRHTLGFRFEGVDGQASPAWWIQQERFDLSGHRNDYTIHWQGRDETIGLGWRTASGHRLLLGPNRYELRSPHGSGGTVSLGWVTPDVSHRLSVTETTRHWQVEADLPSDYVYLGVAQEDLTLYLSGSELGGWRIAADRGAWSLRLNSDRDEWPVVSDDWGTGTASLRKLDIHHRRLALTYRPELPRYWDALGMASSRWQSESQAIVPQSPSPASVTAEARLDATDLWLDAHWAQWHGRIAVRHVEPRTSGRESSVFFPGITNTWAPFPIREAVLLGARVQWRFNVTPRNRLTLFAQQWVPLYYDERSTPSDNNGSGDGDGSGGGDTPAPAPDSSRQNRGGFQAGFVFTLR